MDLTDLPEASRDLIEAAEIEARSIFEAFQRDGQDLRRQAYQMGVSLSCIDFAPGNLALKLAREQEAQGRELAADYLLRITAGEWWKGLKPDVAAFMAKLGETWQWAHEKFQLNTEIPKALEGSWRAWALRARAAGGASKLEQPQVGAGVPGARRGYRAEVRQWMLSKGLRTIPEAARRLAVGVDTLKSIMSSKGKRRYGDGTLRTVLKAIGYGEP
jgi:hypothetical protein